MAKNIVWFITVVAMALLQTTWPDPLKVQNVVPDLCLLLVVYFAITEGEERAMFTAALGGIYQDVASNAVLGHHVLSLVILGYCLSRVSKRLITEHPAVKAALVLGGALAHGTLYTTILCVQKPGVEFFYTLAVSVVPAAFYTALLAPLLFPLLARLFHRKETLQGGTA